MQTIPRMTLTSCFRIMWCVLHITGILDNPDPCGNRYFANADRSAMHQPKADHKLTPKDLDRAREFGRFICDIFWRSNHYATGFIIGSIPYCASLGAERRRHFLVMTNHHVWKKVNNLVNIYRL